MPSRHASLPPEFLTRLTREFAGERMLWAGQPSPRASFLKGLLSWWFAIPWTVFALAWEGIALGIFFAEGAARPDGVGGVMAWVFPIFGLPFVIIGIGMLVPFWAARKARRTVHVLTEKRLVTAVFGRELALTSLDPKRILSVAKLESPDGSGTLTLSLGNFRDSDGASVEKLEHWIGVPDVATLEAETRRLLEAQKR